MKARLLLALVVGGLSACGGQDTVEPPAELVEFDAQLTINELWKHKVGNGSERLRLGLAPATDGMFIYAGALNGNAAAFGLEDGEALWSVNTDQRLTAGPGVGDGLVVFGTSDGYLVALDAATGATRWEQPVGSEVLAAPVVGRDVVVFRTVDGRLTAVSVADGEELWTYLQALPVLTLRGNSAPLIVNNVVVAGFDNGLVGAYNLADGTRVWESALATPSGRSEIDRLVDVGVDLEIFGNNVYAASFQGRAAAFILANGQDLWDKELSSFTGLGVDAEHVYVTNDFSAVIALNRQDGSIEEWRQEALRLRDITAAARYRETVVVGDYDGYMHWLDAGDGSFLARRRAASARIAAKPLAIGPRLFVQSEDGTIVAFEIAVEESD
jgi:outer membrane protein assembly factor BamB